jgi:hypothetical protein
MQESLKKENAMRNVLLLSMLACFALAANLPASAQSGDVAYCQALAQKYQRYVGDSDARRKGQMRDSKLDAAIAQCSSNSAAAIPVLEQALRDAKVELPSRG